MLRWILPLTLTCLLACKGDGTGDDTSGTDDSSVDDSSVDDTGEQETTGTITGKIDFPVPPPTGPLYVGLASGDRVFETLVHIETYTTPSFPDQQTYSIDIEPGVYYIGAWIDAGNNNAEAPGDEDPKGVALGGGPASVAVDLGVSVEANLIRLKRPAAEPE